LRAALAVAKPLGLSRYGPEQVRFLQYRPVLDNQALKRDFGYQPDLTSAEVFDLWQKAAGL
jgi:UDP-glucose 4-epimerase